MILLIDNYDSFTFNLAQQVAWLGKPFGFEVKVVRNDGAEVSDLLALAPKAVLISPGPGGPQDTGVSLEILAALPEHTPILGVCLGHQTLAYYYGARVVRALRPLHGKRWQLNHSQSDIFVNVPSPCVVARYHSLVVEHASLPSSLKVLGSSPEGEIMSLRHRTLPRFGVQFHPESFLTENGDLLITEFLAFTHRTLHMASTPIETDAQAPAAA